MWIFVASRRSVIKKNRGSTTFGSGEEKYKFWYSGNNEGTNGVGVLLLEELLSNVIEV